MLKIKLIPLVFILLLLALSPLLVSAQSEKLQAISDRPIDLSAYELEKVYENEFSENQKIEYEEKYLDAITSISETSVPRGSSFTITGIDMTTTTVVRIGGVDQDFQVINDTTIMVIVVDGATPLGAQDLVIGSGGPLSDPLSITIDANVSDDGVEVTSEWEQITFDPGVGAEKRHHMFGYIGHGQTMPWNKSGRYILCLRIADYKRIPVKGETADVCVIDTQNDYEVIKLTETRGWNLQQGTMFNWNPLDPENQFFFNDCAEGPNGGSTWTVLYDISDVATGGTGERVKEYKFDGSPGTPPRWVANHGVAPDGSFFVGINYGRLTFRSTTMIGYVDNYAPNGYLPLAGDGSENWPTNDGLWKVDIATGEATLIVSYDEIHSKYGGPEPYVHHTLVNRLSNRISFITRGGFPPSGDGKGINRASVVNVEGAHNLREIPVIGAYHPEWYEGITVANSGPVGKYDIYDVDTQSNTGNYIGVDNTFITMSNDNAYGPNGKWFVCGTPLTNPARFDYQFFRISDSYKLTPNANTGLASAREILTGDVRIDDAPRWNRLGNAILVGGETTGAVKTRQLAIIRLVPNTNH